MGRETAARPGDRQSPDDVPLERVAAVTTYEGELLVYDVEEEEAWIQGDDYRSLEEWA